jgi:peroxiredoxin
MKTTMKMSWSIACVLLVGGLAGATPKAAPLPAAPQPTPTAKVGTLAPDFQLVDTDGKAHTRAGYVGKIIVLEWFSASCAFSGADTQKSIFATGRAGSLQKQLNEIDPTITYLLIDSTARRNSKEELIAAGQAAKKKWKIESPILIDFDGAVGHAYRAQTTPHVFVIDVDGVLRYQGAFDTNKRGGAAEDHTNHVLEAVKKLKAGESPFPTQTRPWGCSVKFAP